MTGILKKTQGPATYADLVALPDNVIGEIIGGQLFASPWLAMPQAAALDRIRKFSVYAREKVGHVWFADPAVRTLEVFRLLDGHWASVAGYEGDAKVRAEPFDAVELDPSRWWLEP